MIPPGARERAIATAREAGSLLRDMIGRVDVEFKGAVNLVTAADRASEELIAERISTAFPQHRLLGEEGIAGAASTAETGTFVWIVDPLDGTTNFAHGYPHYAVSIGLVHERTVVLGVVFDPSRDEMFVAERGKGAWLNDRPLHASANGELIRS